MVEMTRRSQVTVFKVFDREGRHIGEVVQPKAAPTVGLGAKTVLLVRDENEGDRTRSRRDALLPAQHSLLRV
jgi:hypothetical protein